MQKQNLVETVWGYFEKLSEIPRGSGNESGVADWLAQFGQELGLRVIRDAYNNVVIFKDGQHGGESADAVVLQAHSDMVCVKTDESAHDFTKDPLRLIEKDGWISASGTTLGADNGLGAAFICALLADRSIPHPPVEAVITSGEEVGMDGMNAFDAACLLAKRMINLDAEENGVLIASCAGGVRSELSLPVSRAGAKAGYAPYRALLAGLSGGHSGIEIHRGAGNAILLIGRVMADLMEAFDAQPCALSAGTAANVIPSKAELVFYADPARQEAMAARLEELRQIFLRELGSADAAISLCIEPCEESAPPFSAETARRIAGALSLLPNGALGYHENLPGQVNLSSNPGVLRTGETAVTVVCLSRGHVDSAMHEVVEKLRALALLCGGELAIVNEYGAWEYACASRLRELAQASHRRQCGREMTVSSIHGGLECALMAKKIEGLDMIALGCTLLDVHTPSERFELRAAKEFWAYLAELLSTELLQ